MNNIQKRFILFLFGCIVVRFLFVYIAKNYTKYLKQMGLIALVISFGFFYVYFTRRIKCKESRENFSTV
jgi:hypothetical protein